MAAIVTFDGANKIITEISAAGDNSIDAIEIYSEWKEWVRMSDNSKFLQAFSVLGGEPLSGSEALGTTFFLENGWRIRPAELDHKLVVAGNLFTREAGQSAFLDTLGAFTVNVETRTSSLVTAGFWETTDISLVVAALVGKVTISLDDQTVTIFDEDGVTTLAVLDVTADGRIRTRTS